jgi:hypothetical protein
MTEDVDAVVEAYIDGAAEAHVDGNVTADDLLDVGGGR